MATFQYRGFDALGKPVRGLLEAVSPKSAREELLAKNILVERINTTSRGMRFSPRARAVLYRELASLLEAGIPLSRALGILIDTPVLSEASARVARIRDAVKEGADLAAAFAAGGGMTAFENAMLTVAEQSASVAPILERLADFLEEHEDIQQRLRSALIYPAIVAATGVCVSVVMMGVLLPRMQSFLTEAQVQLPAVTRFMLAAGQFARGWGILVAAMLVGAAAAYRLRLRSDARLRRTWDRRLFRLPVLGTGYTLLANMRFARTLCLLLQGGVPLIEGFALAGKATGSPWIDQLAQDEADRVRHGEKLSAAIARIPPLSAVLPGWVRVGEASGGMTRLMQSAARRYEVQWNRFLSRAMSILEPAIILVIGGFVLLVTLSVLLPVLDLSQSIQR